MNIITISSVFPNSKQSVLGLFIYERMKHVAKKAHVRVISPIPWSPFDSLIRLFKKNFRPARKGAEVRGNLEVTYIYFFCLPGVLKFLDGFLYYFSLLKPIKKIVQEYKPRVLDVHFAYPDGLAVMLLSRKLGLPFCVTLRGSETPYSKSFYRRIQMRWVFKKADKIICVSKSLSEIALKLGAEPSKIKIIPNGINIDTFYPRNRSNARNGLGLDENDKVILSVGGLVKRKGFHRVIRQLPKLVSDFKDLKFIVVGGGSVEGDYSKELKDLVSELKLTNVVRFEGVQPPEKLPYYYSASDLFVLATANEGWPNVIVESLACGTPVVATDVGGIKEIISNDYLGYTVPFGDSSALEAAIRKGLKRDWDNSKIAAYGQNRSWAKVADEVVAVFNEIVSRC